MLLGDNGFDLPRNSDGTALIGDPLRVVSRIAAIDSATDDAFTRPWLLHSGADGRPVA